MSRDYHRVDPFCENAVVGGWPARGPGLDEVYEVDDEGWLRYDDGSKVPDVGPPVLATDVDPDAWGDHYHHPVDCPDKEPPFRSRRAAVESGCDDCTFAADKGRGRVSDYVERPETDADPEEVRERAEEAIEALGGWSPGPAGEPRFQLMVSRDTHEALAEEAPADGGVFAGRSASMSPDGPYFPLNPDGFESLVVRKWRRRVEDEHMKAEGILQ